MRARPGILILVLTLLAPLPAMAQESGAAARVGKLVARGDAIFNQKGGKGATWKAIGFYREALKVDSRSFAAHWRVARGFARLARLSREQGVCDGKFGHKGHYHAVQAMAISPDRVEGFYWGAAGIGERGKCMPMIKALTNGIRGKFTGYPRKALRLDPSYDDGGPPRMLAMYNSTVPIPLKDRDRSFKQIRHSWELSPGHPRTLFCWAQILWEAGRKAEARQKLKHCTKANGGGSPALNRSFQTNCRKLLRNYEG